MKNTIIINESQLALLRNVICESILLNNGETKEYGDSTKVTNQPTIHDSDGKPIDSDPMDTNRFGAERSEEGWIGSARPRI